MTRRRESSPPRIGPTNRCTWVKCSSTSQCINYAKNKLRMHSDACVGCVVMFALNTSVREVRSSNHGRFGKYFKS
uniref:Uncharacterized protein n=1 Tax=Ditylenchus dipsaci TaxID=166011 RepID=A0A915EL96_9BILA